MNVIRQSNPDVIRFLGGHQQKKSYYNYRFNKYCVFVDLDDRTKIIYNTLTGSIVQLRQNELDNVFSEYQCDCNDNLLWNYFIVREDFDEDAVIDAYRERNRKFLGANYLESPSSFVIMTTSDCNARCPYCYELSKKDKKHMTKETAEQVAKYIIDNASKFDKTDIQFFGGEPLYNYEAIDTIVGKVRGAGFETNITMISNGYLFNDKMVDIAVKDWDIRNVQITLDGPEEYYNKTKRYIYKDDPNPFKTVIKNIHNLTRNGIAVTIRLNCGIHNAEGLKQLIEYLGGEFMNDNLISIYVWEIFQLNTPQNSDRLWAAMKSVNKLINDFNMQLKEPDLPMGIKTGHCMVDSGNTVFINELGEIGLCEHYIDSLTIGNINNPKERNWDVIKSWTDYVDSNTEICKSCSLRAICLKMHKCTDENICDNYARDYQIDKVQGNLISFVKTNQQQACEYGCN